MDVGVLTEAMQSIRDGHDELNVLRNETRVALAAIEAVIDTIYTLFAALIIFFMQAGFALLEAGSVRSQSVADILMKNVIDVGVGSMTWFLIGYMLSADGGSSFIGWPTLSGKYQNITSPFDAIDAAHGDTPAKYLLSYMYAVTAATIVSGAIAERTHQRAYIFSSIAVTGLIYPCVVHWVWSHDGWLSHSNPHAVQHAFDFAGGGVVHLTGGVVALVAARVVGPRKERFDPRTCFLHGEP